MTHETVEACYNTLELFENEKALLGERTRMWALGKWDKRTGFSFPRRAEVFCTISSCAIGTLWFPVRMLSVWMGSGTLDIQ